VGFKVLLNSCVDYFSLSKDYFSLFSLKGLLVDLSLGGGEVGFRNDVLIDRS